MKYSPGFPVQVYQERIWISEPFFRDFCTCKFFKFLVHMIDKVGFPTLSHGKASYKLPQESIEQSHFPPKNKIREVNNHKNNHVLIMVSNILPSEI